jgi:hypothetical protein
MDKKKAWPPRKTPQNGLYVFCQHKNKTLFPHIIARRINEAATGGAGAEYLIFHSLCGPVDRKKPITRAARVRWFYLFSGIE